MTDFTEGKVAETPQEAYDLQQQGYWKCANVKCPWMISPEVLDHAHQTGDTEGYRHTCPHCGLTYELKAVPGQQPGTFNPGGRTNSGLGLGEMAQVGEDLVQGLGELPGYGPLHWFHTGGATAASAFDGIVEEWGVEVKSVSWNSQNIRGIIDPQERVRKNQAAEDPKLWAQQMQDPKLVEIVDQRKFKGVLGVLVVLNFMNDVGDVYVREMPHTEWVNENGRKLRGCINFRAHTCKLVAQNVKFENPLPQPGSYQKPSGDDFGIFSKTALDYAGDALPADQPQLRNDIDRAYESEQGMGMQNDSEEYSFFFANGHLNVSADHSHDELREHGQIERDHSGPTAVGYVLVNGRQATWQVTSNAGLSSLTKIFKDYTTSNGWKWGGITSLDGEPINDGQFGPKKSMWFAVQDDHLYLSEDQRSFERLGAATVEAIDVVGKTAYLNRDTIPEALQEWADDHSMTVRLADYPGGTNMLDRTKNMPKEDLETYNRGDINNDNPDDWSFFPDIKDQYHQREPSGMYRCRNCDRLLPNWNAYKKHLKDESPPTEDSKFPEVNTDGTFPTHFTEMQPNIHPVASTDWEFAAAAVKVDDNVPFIFDVKEDSIYIGQPGERHSDVQGPFTPGGIVEGTYEPNGKVVVRSLTNMPYTVRHMVELWYYQHPELEVKNVHLEDTEGKSQRLAANNVGGFIMAQVASDPAASVASKALRGAGGNVYAVGGAVRDALLNKDPKDIDLMVQGMPSDDVRKALEALPGRVDLTGKDFGVYRYRDKGNEVEIALPRRERSTGEGHKDFSIDADHTMPVEEDLNRRDFTANAIAVDLETGTLLDPHNGAEDIKEGTLRTVHPDALDEDPLRTVRALVAHSRHGLHPDARTRHEMKGAASNLEHLPNERIQAELDKLFGSKDPASAIQLAHDTGVLKHILPEVDAAFGYDQNNPHHERHLGDHLVEVLRRTAQQTDDPDLRLAAILHDIGKPNSAWIDPETGKNHYYHNHSTGQGADHETVGADMADARLRELKYPTSRIDKVKDLVQHHMWNSFESEKGARRFLNKVEPHADDLMTLRWADQGGKDLYPNDPTQSLDKQRNLIERVRNQGDATNQSSLALNGHDLIASGISPGPELGRILRALTQEVVDDPSINNKETLLERAHRL